MSSVFLISDAAKKVEVEAHVLRYWEEELGLPIKRNELGHRYYTEEDVERFREIKNLKERGLQLKAIRMILKNGKLDMLPIQYDGQADSYQKENADVKNAGEEEDCLLVHPAQQMLSEESREEKAARLQWLLQQLFRETLQENNVKLCREMKESILKELDYQFRMQEEREDEREAERTKRDEAHFKRIDELLRKKRGLIKK